MEQKDFGISLDGCELFASKTGKIILQSKTGKQFLVQEMPKEEPKASFSEAPESKPEPKEIDWKEPDFETKEPFHYLPKEELKQVVEISQKHIGKSYLSATTKRSLMGSTIRIAKEYNRYSSKYLYGQARQQVNNQLVVRMTFRDRAYSMTMRIIEREIARLILRERGVMGYTGYKVSSSPIFINAKAKGLYTC